jgi:phage-related minor tail protein
MQLQTDIVKSYDAVRAAIETLMVEPGNESDVLDACKALKFELGGRFDYIAHRWEHLSELMKQLRLTQQAEKSEADWTHWLAG